MAKHEHQSDPGEESNPPESGYDLDSPQSPQEELILRQHFAIYLRRVEPDYNEDDIAVTVEWAMNKEWFLMQLRDMEESDRRHKHKYPVDHRPPWYERIGKG